jgi:hypothetical protein
VPNLISQVALQLVALPTPIPLKIEKSVTSEEAKVARTSDAITVSLAEADWLI